MATNDVRYDLADAKRRLAEVRDNFQKHIADDDLETKQLSHLFLNDVRELDNTINKLQEIAERLYPEQFPEPFDEENYLIVYEMSNVQPTNEVESSKGNLDTVISDALTDNRHLNNGRSGVKIYRVGEPVFQKFDEK